MLIVLLMALFVSAEWVEISQNHYRKEPFQLSYSTTAKNIAYNNHSILEHQWSKGYVDRVPSIKKVQQQRIQGVDKIERNRFHREDFLTMNSPKHRAQINGLKSENSVRNNIRYENQHNVSYVQRIQQSTVRDENQINDKNISRNKLDTNKNNNNKLIDRETLNSKKLTTTDKFKKIKLDAENLSETLQQVVTEADKVNFQMDITEKSSEEKNKKVPNDETNYTPPKDEDKRKKTNNIGMDTLIKLVKTVSQTIQRGTRRSFTGKVRYLEELKMSLLTSIEERIESAFPDDTEKLRRRRSSNSESRGHVEFPSSESALMTISFLTFAVFLIKLVLQVIHTYKAKTMMVTPAVVATVGRAGKVFRNPSNN